RLVAGLGGAGVEGVVDVGRDLLGLLAAAAARLVLGHGLGDVLGEFFDRAVADQRFRMILAAFPVEAMAVRALLEVDLLSHGRLGGGGLGLERGEGSREGQDQQEGTRHHSYFTTRSETPMVCKKDRAGMDEVVPRERMSVAKVLFD